MSIEEIRVKNQNEFDDAAKSNIRQRIIIVSNETWITIRETIHIVVAWGSSHVVALGSSHVVAWGSSHVEARESSHVEARESSHVVAWGSSHVEARESSHVEARESSHVVAWGSSHVVARESSHVVARESSHVVAWGSSHVVARESSHVVARESSHVVARESSHVVARESSHVVARESSTINGKSSMITVEAWHHSIVILTSCNPVVTQHGDSVIILRRETFVHTKQTFIECYSDQVNADGYIELFKSVQPNDTDFYTGKIKYEGVVECSDWDPNPDRQCGGGFHLSPTPEQALSYNYGKLKRCLVHIDDIVVYGPDISKVRCRRVEVVGDYDDGEKGEKHA